MPANVSITVRHCASLGTPVPPFAPFAQYTSLLIQRREDIWGSAAHIFDPNRWLGTPSSAEDLKNKVHVGNPWAYTPFNAGPRICLGQQFAYTEASFLIIRLLQRVASLELAPEAQPEGTLPPSSWASSSVGRESVERCRPVSSLTLSVKVGALLPCRQATHMSTQGGLWIRARMKDGYTHLQRDKDPSPL